MCVEGDGANQGAFDEDIVVTSTASYRPLSRPGRTQVVVSQTGGASLANVLSKCE